MHPSHPKPPTMQDVAERADVSAMTVSRVLRNHPEVAAATRARVTAAIDELGYRPNPLLTALVEERRRKSDPGRGTVLAYIVDENYQIGSAGYASTLFAGARNQAQRLGFSLEVFPVGRKQEDEYRVDEILYSRGIPGMILAPMPLEIPFRCYDFNWERYAAVTLGYGFEGVSFGSVRSDHYQAMRRILAECALRNIGRIGLIMSQVFHQRVDQRVEAAYVIGCGKHRISPLILGAWDDRVFVEWLKKNNPEVLVSSVLYLPQLYAALKRADLHVANDIGLISLNTSPEPGGTEYDSMVLTGVDPVAHQMGVAAVNRLTAQLFRNERGVPGFCSCTTIPTQWVSGETLAE